MLAIGVVLPLEVSLRHWWDKGKYMLDAAGRPGGDAQRGAQIDSVDQTIQDVMFWSYVRAMDFVSEVLDEIVTWAEGCPCHSNDPSLKGASRHFRTRQFRERVGGVADVWPL